jgi:hypothetical protein
MRAGCGGEADRAESHERGTLGLVGSSGVRSWGQIEARS